MTPTSRFVLIAVATSLTLAACGSDSAENTTPAAAPATTEAVVVDTTATVVDTTEVMVEDTEAMVEDTDAMADEDAEVMAELAGWQKLTLTDVAGVAFTIGDFVGRPVFVENFATWCPKCRSQLAKTNDAAAELGDEAVFLALSTETDLSPGDVADYAADNGFTNLRFAVMTPEFLASISEALGTSSINPPSTPHLTIDAAGVPGELRTGSEDPDAIVATVRAGAT